MNPNNKKKICLIVPSLKTGGMERVMSEVANYFSKDEQLDIHLILFSNKEPFFSISPKINIHQPTFDAKNRMSLIFKNLIYLRNKLKYISPHSLLSFGSMYNSFVILASLGLNIKVYVSDRGNPYRNTEISFKNDPIKDHDGILHYFLKKNLYKYTDGLFVQTELAKKIESEFLGHKNIILFPNPIREIKKYPKIQKKNWIINVGRFIDTKNQKLLIKIFHEINNCDWKLIFAGEGPELESSKKLVAKLNLEHSVKFLGNVSEIDKYYRKSEIFAFTSVSEGFPNALAEAMKASLACISFDCTAGPSDLIKDGGNGFLVPEGSIDVYKDRLELLMTDKELRRDFQVNAAKKMQELDPELIMNKIKKEMIS